MWLDGKKKESDLNETRTPPQWLRSRDLEILMDTDVSKPMSPPRGMLVDIAWRLQYAYNWRFTHECVRRCPVVCLDEFHERLIRIIHERLTLGGFFWSAFFLPNCSIMTSRLSQLMI